VSLFEYISIATSLILSFSLARTLTNLAPIFASPRRYWVHSTWVLALLVYHANLFWQLWLYHEVASWEFPEFLLFLLGPTLLLVSVSLLVPTEPVEDYRAYFESTRRPFYSVLIAMQLQPMPLPFLLFDIPFSAHPLLLGNVIFAAIATVGLLGRRHVIDAVLVCLYVLGLAGGMATLTDHETMMEAVRSLRP
jgi:hypothetical protein